MLLENIRSAYNVGNIIRTADALWWKVWISWYTPSPTENKKVGKTSLGAEDHVWLERFDTTIDAIKKAKDLWYQVIAAEVTPSAVSLATFKRENEDIVVVFGNEVEWVLEKTLTMVDEVVYIPMEGIKESLNVGQTTAIFMWQLKK